MMRIHRWLFAAIFGIAVTSLAAAQNQGTFVFSSDPDKVEDPKSALAARPNTPDTRYLFVRNPKGDKETYIVELRDSKGRAVIASGKIELEKNQQARVKLEKTPPPAAPKGVATPAAVPTTPPAAAPEPPPGIELKRDADGQFRFLLRLLDEQGKPVLDNQKNPIETRVPVELRQPFSYIDEPSIAITRINDDHKLDVTVKSAKSFSGPPSIIELYFPPQKSLQADALRAGAYRRVIKGPEQTVKLQANDLPVVDGTEEKVRFSVNVDGYARAFIYEPDFRRPSDQALLTLVRTPAVRVYPAASDRPVLVAAAKPGDKYPVRVEVDNAPLTSKLSLRFDRSGSGTFAESDEVLTLPSTREEKVFLEPQGEDESLIVNFRVSDWIQPLDTRALRGKHEIQGVLDNDGKEIAKFSFFLILDDTAPEGIEFGKLPAQHVKGTPLKVTAFAKEPETVVTQATFFLGKPADGKLPEGPKAEGDLVDAKLGLWAGELPIPDKKGFIEIGVQFVNETGIAAVKTQKIELIDPPAPPTTGIVEGTVVLGDLGQPGVPVQLRDADGNQKGAATTNDKGAFKIEGVPPGAYRVLSAKEDSGVGNKGAAAVQVQAGKTSKATVELSRRPLPAK